MDPIARSGIAEDTIIQAPGLTRAQIRNLN